MNSVAGDAASHNRIYFMVFGALMVLTITTVFAGYVSFPIGVGITIALIIASVKGSLVAAYFMHLSNEQRIIYWILTLTFVLLTVMFVLFISLFFSQGGTVNVS